MAACLRPAQPASASGPRGGQGCRVDAASYCCKPHALPERVANVGRERSRTGDSAPGSSASTQLPRRFSATVPKDRGPRREHARAAGNRPGRAHKVTEGSRPFGGSPSVTKGMEHHHHMGSPVMRHQKRSEDQPRAGPQFLASPCSFRLPVKGGCNVRLLPSFLPLAPLERLEGNACSPPFGSLGKMKQEPIDTRTPSRRISTGCPIKSAVLLKRRQRRSLEQPCRQSAPQAANPQAPDEKRRAADTKTRVGSHSLRPG